ncbi:MAG: ATP-grasp fold amidoligase family protein [Clostridia bacterium]
MVKRKLIKKLLDTGFRLHLFDKMSDEKYLKMIYKARMGKELNLENPQSYNEKLQWLKLYDRKDIYTTMVDKYAVKEYVAELIGEEYIIPTLGLWDNFDEIGFDDLPEQFVLKCTHDSGGLVICTDKSKLDKDAAKKKINKCLKTNFYSYGREWPYKNVPRKIIAEKYMVDESGTELKDYKFFCFDGEVKAMFIASDRANPNEETKFDFFDRDFNHLPFTNGHPNSDREVQKPQGFDKMVELAEVLSKGLPHVRIDFYDIYGKVYFGEITFFHWSGMTPFEPEEWDNTFGSWIKLPK